MLSALCVDFDVNFDRKINSVVIIDERDMEKFQLDAFAVKFAIG